MGTHVSEQTLLEGSLLALEQSGRLLRSAVSLLDSGDFGSAVALGMLGREELGWSRLLRHLSGEVHAGRTFSAKDVAQRCGDHVAKQEASALSTTVRTTSKSQVNQTSDAAVEAKRKRQPHDRHAVRCDGLYVDLNDAGTDWKCPRDISEQDALNHITDAVNDYAGELDKLKVKELWHAHPQVRGKAMDEARQKMSRTVDLPAPPWPRVKTA